MQTQNFGKRSYSGLVFTFSDLPLTAPDTTGPGAREQQTKPENTPGTYTKNQLEHQIVVMWFS